MKKLLSVLLSIVVLMSFSTPFGADTVYRYGDWTLGVVSSLDDYAFSIRSYDGDDAFVTVPSDYGGYPIVEIEEYAFATNTNLQEVTLSDSINSIGAGAFSQCVNLTKIVIPNAATQIGDNAFQGCDQVVIYAVAESDPITYAIEHQIAYVLITADAYVLGDADGDGEITVADASAIQRFLCDLSLADPDVVERNGDVDGEGLGSPDAAWILRHVADMETPYEIGEWISVTS